MTDLRLKRERKAFAPRLTRWGGILVLVIAQAVGVQAGATVHLPVDEPVTFEVQGWAITCSGFTPRLSACSAVREIEGANVTIYMDESEGRIELQGSCTDGKKVATVPIRFPMDPADGQIAELVDNIFLEQFEGCQSPHDWPLLQEAEQVAYIVYKVTRRN